MSSTADQTNTRNSGTTAPAGVTVDEIFHTRLITKEYFGGRSNPRGTIAKCSLKFRDMCHQLSTSQHQADASSIIEDVQRELQMHNLEMRKMALMERSMEADLKEYDQLQQFLDSSKHKIREEIKTLQQSLASERLIRNDKLEYEALAKIVNTLPSKMETQEKLNVVQKELDVLKDEEVQRDSELGIREKQFQLLLQSIFDLKSSLEEDNTIMTDEESSS